ncbi:hypothetical protein [Anaerocolumna jejuensis]|uniref:hypothetical protein n=1 Tax=Anaerocolumna jejuensis TaxID=259063 RepID=UPI003F7C4B67
MVFRQKSIWIFAAVLLLIAAGIAIAYFAQNTERNIHKGTLVYERNYMKTADIKGKVPNEECTPLYKD